MCLPHSNALTPTKKALEANCYASNMEKNLTVALGDLTTNTHPISGAQPGTTRAGEPYARIYAYVQKCHSYSLCSWDEQILSNFFGGGWGEEAWHLP